MRPFPILPALLLAVAGLSACTAPAPPGPPATAAAAAEAAAQPAPAEPALPPLPPPPAEPGARPPVAGEPGNLLQNPGFEEDWFDREFAKNRRFLLLAASDLGMGQEDGLPDYWAPRGIGFPEAWDTTVARGGGRSVRLNAAGSVTQRVRWAGEQNWKTGGAHYAEFLPLDRALHEQLVVRPITVGVWCKTEGVPAGAEPELTLVAECRARRGPEDLTVVNLGNRQASVKFSPGTHDWEYREVTLNPGDLPGAPMWLAVRLSAAGRGTVWYDDVTLREAGDAPPPVPNGSFEAAGPDGWPTGWGRAENWEWWRSRYYLFTGWSHRGNPRRRGGVAPESVVAAHGGRSLRFTVYPGDSLAVRGDPIALNQDRARPIEVRALVRADRLRGLEVMAMDERGRWLPQPDFLGDDMEDNPDVYNMGSTGCGTYDWRTVRKFFAPREPVKSLRLYLCARGFDGAIVGRNHVGTVWFDQVTLREHGRPTVPAPATPAPPAAFQVAALDPGDRLWGRNRAEAWLRISGDAAAFARAGRFSLELTDPAGRTRRSQGRLDAVAGWVRAAADYLVPTACRDWLQQYRLTLTLQPPQGAARALTIPFGTPSALLTVGQSAHYAYPNERVTVTANLNVSRHALAELGAAEFVRVGGVGALARVENLAEALKPQRGPRYADATRLLTTVVAASPNPPPWDRPARDHVIRVRLLGRDGKPVAESEVVRFGFLQPPPRHQFPNPMRRTSLDSRGYIQVNGEPFFPVFWTPHFGIAPEAIWPPRLFRVYTPDLNPLLGGKPPGPDSRARIVARVRDVKRDTNLFGWVLGEGEMQLQGGNWEERAGWLKTVTEWVRAEDPDHLVLGPESWLIGHPRHNETFAAFVPHFDVVGVEASFEEVPKIREFARPLMKGKPTAVLVGLETYFYQTPETLRWRGYLAAVEGAAGVGLCPSGMLEARPDRVNYLRGLNAEFRSLGPVLTAPAPKDAIRVTPTLETLERVHGGRRYLIALRPRGSAPGAVRARFAFPPGARFTRVAPLFEGPRQVPVTAAGFEDDFPEPTTVRVYELAP